MDELVEVFRRWQAGESPRRIAKALGLVRNTVRSYLRAAEGAGIGRDRVLSPEEWAVFVREHFPAIESGAARAVWWAELEQRRDEIVQALAQNRVTTVWQRMHGDGKVGCRRIDGALGGSLLKYFTVTADDPEPGGVLQPVTRSWRVVQRPAAWSSTSRRTESWTSAASLRRCGLSIPGSSGATTFPRPTARFRMDRAD